MLYSKEIVTILIIVYYIICLIYFAYVMYKSKEIYKPLIAFSVPFIGFLIIFVIRIRKNKEVIDIFTEDEIVKREQRGIGVETLEDSVFMNIQDGLILGDLKDRRKLMLNIIKSNPEDYIGPLKDALNNEDVETSHYAASAITNMQSKFLIKLQKYNYSYKNNKDNVEFLTEYAKVLNTYINSGLADEKNKASYMPYYKSVLVQLIELNSALIEHFSEIINIELGDKNYSTSLKYANLFMEKYPNIEEAYMSALKVSVESKDNNTLKRIIETIKESNVDLSAKNLSYFRYWLAVYNQSYM